ncbi:unnamed protein product [Dibothriocephalus latus]|uniref:Uncharacterized protein n=1 Tax=Dibothriocephalus latus TaxID=60516 RepID=A0A3P7L3T4_DIBLA|nr:unnamed protein product [Dibothriocephalus latus]
MDQLEKIIAATDELKTLERDLDRWMSRTETELASALGLFSDPSVSAAERKSAIQVSAQCRSYVH